MNMSDQYPLFPELPAAGQEEAQCLIDKFKEAIKKAADEAIGDFYCDVALHIESDSWQNYRNEMMDGFRNYDNRKVQGEYDFKEIRQAILKEHKADIVEDLNQDMLEEIKGLKDQIKFLNELRDHSY
jgi:hypothetical protein